MESYTTVRVSHDTRDRLEEFKREGETWDGCLARVAERLEDEGEPEGLEEMAERLEAVEDRLDHIPERTADTVEGRLR